MMEHTQGWRSLWCWTGWCGFVYALHVTKRSLHAANYIFVVFRVHVFVLLVGMINPFRIDALFLARLVRMADVCNIY